MSAHAVRTLELAAKTIKEPVYDVTPAVLNTTAEFWRVYLARLLAGGVTIQATDVAQMLAMFTMTNNLVNPTSPRLNIYVEQVALVAMAGEASGVEHTPLTDAERKARKPQALTEVMGPQTDQQEKDIYADVAQRLRDQQPNGDAK